jgi:hypothetical protein
MNSSQIVQVAAAWVPALLIGLSGVMKLTGSAAVREGLTKLGVVRHVRLLGLAELIVAALFVIPTTMKLGFILASCYLAGAIATELSHDALTASPFVPLALLWIGAFLRDSSVFLTTK